MQTVAFGSVMKVVFPNSDDLRCYLERLCGFIDKGLSNLWSRCWNIGITTLEVCYVIMLLEPFTFR